MTRSRWLNPNSDRTEYFLVTTNNRMHRNVDVVSVTLGNISVELSKSIRRLGFVFYNQLNLIEQIDSVKRKIIVILIIISRITSFIDKSLKNKTCSWACIFYTWSMQHFVLWPNTAVPHTTTFLPPSVNKCS